MQALTWGDVWRGRLRRHWLSDPAPADRMLDVVGDVCGTHAQVAASAELSLGLRVRDISRQHVRDALWKDRSLVKTYGLRGTLHLFPSRELPLWLAALRARTPPRGANEVAHQILPPRRQRMIVEAIADALGERPVSREELAAEVEQRLGTWATDPVFPAFGGQWPRWQLALGSAAAAGLIVFGPNRGSRVTYVRTDRWLDTPAQVDGQTALREVARRFFWAYGPATSVEFARWFAMHPKASRELVESMAAEATLERVEVEGWRAFETVAEPRGSIARAKDSGRENGRERRIHLLPHFDCYVVGCHPRAQLIPSSAPAVMQKGTAAQFAVVLVDGVVGGVWERKRQGKAFVLRVDTFAPLSRREQDAVAEEAERIGAIVEAPVALEFGAVEARGHL